MIVVVWMVGGREGRTYNRMKKKRGKKGGKRFYACGGR